MQSERLQAIATTAPPALAAAGIVHDLGNLIQIASSAIAIVTRSPQMPAAHSGPMLARARTSLEQAGAIVRQTLGQMRDRQVAMVDTDIPACLAEVAMLVEAMDEPGLVLDVDTERELPQVRCDPLGLQSAILNLAINASDAMAGAGMVSIRARSTLRGTVEISVTDSGVGMSPATVARAFTPFFTTKPGGFGGIGLPMVERFVRETGGELAVDSAPGVGTTITLRLPAVVQPGKAALLVCVDDEEASVSPQREDAYPAGVRSMKLYYSPGACSLSGRISLHEAGLDAEFERVDLATKVTEHGDDFSEINPKGYVPLLVLEDGEALTENAAVLAWLADREPQLAPGGPIGRARLIEMLSYLSSELHTAFKPLFTHDAAAADKHQARETIARRLAMVADHIRELYLFGPRFTVADAYLFAMLRWARAFDVALKPELVGYFERVAERPTVRRALAEEGLV